MGLNPVGTSGRPCMRHTLVTYHLKVRELGYFMPVPSVIDRGLLPVRAWVLISHQGL